MTNLFLRTLLFFSLTLSIHNLACADNCDPKNSLFEWSGDSDAGSPTDRSTPYETRCVWNDGTAILMHAVWPDTWPSQVATISIWVNKAKWIDKAVVYRQENYEFTYVRTTKIAIDHNGLTICDASFHNPGLQDGEDNIIAPETCGTRTKNSMPHDPDPREFPAGRQRAEPPTTRVVQARKPHLCGLILEHAKAKLLKGQPAFDSGWSDPFTTSLDDLADPRHEVLILNPGIPGISASNLPTKLDLLNSGQKSFVLHEEVRSHMNNYDRYYVFDEAGYRNFASGARDDPSLLRYAKAIYPDDWAQCKKGAVISLNASTSYCYREMKFSAIDADGDEINFDPDSVLLSPIIYRQRTYLVLSTLGADQHIIFVVEPLPQKQYDLTCTLEMVKPNP